MVFTEDSFDAKFKLIYYFHPVWSENLLVDKVRAFVTDSLTSCYATLALMPYKELGQISRSVVSSAATKKWSAATKKSREK